MPFDRKARVRAMIRVERHGDITRYEMSSAAGRLIGYTASAYAVRGMLIDCGFPSAHRHVAELVTRERLSALFVTHHHEDHAGNVELLARGGIPIAASAETLAKLRHPEPIRLYRRVTWGTTPRLQSRTTTADGAGLELIPAPGHSTDHHVVWDPRDGTLFGGDLFLGVKVRVAHPGEDPRVLARTLREIAALGPTRLFDAHRGFVENPVPKLIAKADWTDETVAAVERRIVAGASSSAIVRELFGGESMPGYLSGGDYSRTNFVKAVRKGMQP
ncbi:MAG TPA: MBL fold metallo-hydrolase [Gemmatimonadaceae bacterium]|nr:MBL fold metallo-hydrolase [Gemmatimonadaceae bacterium]